MADIFLSYTREDKARAAAVASSLAEMGWSVFWDQRIPAGKSWDDIVEREIGRSKCVVVLWSATSVTRHWVKTEARVALQRNTLVPAILDQVQPPLEFRYIAAAQLQSWAGELNHPEFSVLTDGIAQHVLPQHQSAQDESNASPAASAEPTMSAAPSAKSAPEMRHQMAPSVQVLPPEPNDNRAHTEESSQPSRLRSTQENFAPELSPPRAAWPATTRRYWLPLASAAALIVVVSIAIPDRDGSSSLSSTAAPTSTPVVSTPLGTSGGAAPASSASAPATVIPPSTGVEANSSSGAPESTRPAPTPVGTRSPDAKRSDGGVNYPPAARSGPPGTGLMPPSRPAMTAVGTANPDVRRLDSVGSSRAIWSAAPGTTAFRRDLWLLPDEPLLGFVEIPAGPFTMGSDKRRDTAADGDEQPQHQVTLGRFYIGRYEVTVGQTRAFADAGGKVGADALNGSADLPVVKVSWHEAVSYSQWLDARLRQTVAPAALRDLLSQGAGQSCRVTLPSEAEWEKAARGTDGRIYPWGNTFDASKVNSSESGKGGPAAVGSYPGGASPDGLLNMSGNIWEWTRSHYQPYPYRRDDGREDLAAGEDVRRVVRGGSFFSFGGSVRAAFRGRDLPGDRGDDVGFRVVVSCLRP